MRLRSECEISVRGKRPERALNLCSDRGIIVRGVTKASETEIRLCLEMKDKRTARRLCENAGLECEFLCETGPKATVNRFKTRYVLLVAPLLVVVGVMYLSLFVWEIDVVGNESVSSAEILRTLDDCGFGVGTFTLNTDAALLSNEVLSRLTHLSFMAINIHGSKVDVIVREARKAPESITNFEPPKEVYKQTSVSMPLAYISKRYSGDEFTKNALILGKIRINFYFSSGNYSGSCDIIEENYRLQFLGYSFPISWKVTRYRPWIEEQGTLSVSEAEQILKMQLNKEQPNVIEESYKTQTSDGLVTVKRSMKIYE